MKESLKFMAVALLLVAVALLAGPQVVGAESSQELIGGGTKCWAQAPCPTYCGATPGTMYKFCVELGDPGDWCTQYYFSPCGVYQACADYTFATGSKCD